ncbi:MAG: VOC family protein [Treponema sp.]|nr:VOC family protein [Treponema sp.]
MALDVFLTFNGNCREALDFYSGVFKSNIEGLMTFSDAPASDGYVASESDKNKIMYASLNISGSTVMFSDTPDGMPYNAGNNIVLTVNVTERAEVERLFGALNIDPNPHMPPQQTFFAEYYAMAADKFGLIWNIIKQP